MKKNIQLLTSACLLLLTSCGSLSFAPSKVGQVYSVKKTPNEIEVFRSQQPSKKYIEIGSVTACCSTKTEQLLDKLRLKASENGGDAIIGIEPYAGGGISASVVRYEN